MNKEVSGVQSELPPFGLKEWSKLNDYFLEVTELKDHTGTKALFQHIVIYNWLSTTDKSYLPNS